MKYNYPPLDGKCVKCRGCNRLESENFKRSLEMWKLHRKGAKEKWTK